ncbi:uncharacterized protein LOC143326845 [Chaetodon auriga]|uniref:uncharacterized protein LOC143326845 n=1 Tax=Chaetodon auriga TaxID=39042 RepID=UPI004032A9A8
MSLPLVIPVAFPLSAAEVLNSSAPPELTVPTVSKAIPLENPPETSGPAQEIGGPEEASAQTNSEQPNGVAATQEMTKQTEEIGLVTTPVSVQEAAANPAGDSADLPVPEESVPSAETPIASSEGPQVDKEASPTKGAQSQKSVVAAEESAHQEVEQNSVEARASGDEPRLVAEKILDDPKPSAPEDIGVYSEVGKATDSPETAVADSRNLCQEAVKEEVSPGDVNVNVAPQNENPDKEEPIPLVSKAIQSKGNSKCEGPPLSTHHLSATPPASASSQQPQAASGPAKTKGKNAKSMQGSSAPKAVPGRRKRSSMSASSSSPTSPKSTPSSTPLSPVPSPLASTPGSSSANEANRFTPKVVKAGKQGKAKKGEAFVPVSAPEECKVTAANEKPAEANFNQTVAEAKPAPVEPSKPSPAAAKPIATPPAFKVTSKPAVAAPVSFLDALASSPPKSVEAKTASSKSAPAAADDELPPLIPPEKPIKMPAFIPSVEKECAKLPLNHQNYDIAPVEVTKVASKTKTDKVVAEASAAAVEAAKPAPTEAPKPVSDAKSAPVKAAKPAAEAKPAPVKATKSAPEAKPTPVKAAKPTAEAKPAPIETKPAAEAKAAPVKAAKPAAETKAAPVKAAKPASEAKPTTVEAAKPAAEAKPTSVEAAKPAAEAKLAAPVEGAKPAAEAKPAPVKAAKPAAEAKPAPAKAAKPAAEAKPAPVKASKPAAEAKPAVVEAAKPAAEAKPAPVKDSKPAAGAKPAVVEASKPATEAKSAVKAAKPAAEAKPAVVEATKPAAEAKPAPVEAVKQAAEAKPAPVKAAKPAVEAKHAPVKAAKPAAEAKPAPKVTKPDAEVKTTPVEVAKPAAEPKQGATQVTKPAPVKGAKPVIEAELVEGKMAPAEVAKPSKPAAESPSAPLKPALVEPTVPAPAPRKLTFAEAVAAPAPVKPEVNGTTPSEPVSSPKPAPTPTKIPAKVEPVIKNDKGIFFFLSFCLYLFFQLSAFWNCLDMSFRSHGYEVHQLYNFHDATSLLTWVLLSVLLLYSVSHMQLIYVIV